MNRLIHGKHNRLSLSLLALIFLRFSVPYPDDTSFSQESRSVTIRGFVSDRSSLGGISGAVVLAGGMARALTDTRGFFSFSVEAETIEVQVRMVGFAPATKQVVFGPQDTKADLFFELLPRPVQIDRVLITAFREKENPAPGVITINAADLTSVPRFAESDPLRTIQALPGVTQATTDFDAHIYLRGGNAEETQVQIDGVPMYNPYHFGGWFSVINSEVVGSENLYRSNYPVTSSGVLSGIVDIMTRNPPPDHYTGSASLGLPTVSADIAGPLSTGGVVFSARRTYLDLVVNPLTNKPKDKLPYYFYDLFAKAMLPVSGASSLTLSALYARDSFDPFAARSVADVRIGERPNWENRIFSLSYSGPLTESSTVYALVYSTRSRAGADAEGQDYYLQDYVPQARPRRTFRINNIIDETGGRFAFELAGPLHRLLSGVEFKRLDLAYSWKIEWPGYNDLEERVLPRPEAFYDFAATQFDYAQGTRCLSVFVEDRLTLSERTTMALGYRLENVESAKALLHSPFAEITRSFGTGRLSLRYGRYYQFLSSLKENKNVQNLSTAFTVLFLSEDEQRIASSDHLALDVQVDSLPWSLSLDVEGYYKSRHHLATAYKDPDFRVSYESGNAVGVDLFLRCRTDLLAGWIGYSLSRSVKRNEVLYFSGADRTHALKCYLQVKPFESLRLDLFWTYATGVPFTDISGKYLGIQEPQANYPPDYLWWSPIYGVKNGVRAIDYRRLDIGITWLLIWNNILVSPYLSVFNVTRAPNPNFVSWPNYTTIEESQNSEIVPTIGVTVRF